MPASRPYRWLLTDVDGTLIRDDGTLPERNRQALEHCRRQGVPVVLATGRRWTTLRRLLERLGLEADYAVLNNGMVVKELSTRRVLHQEAFSFAEFAAAAAALDALGLDPIALAHDPDGQTDVFHRRLSLMNGDFVAKNAGHCRAVSDFRELEGLPLVEIILLGPERELAQAQEALRPLDLECALIRNTFYAGYMLEVTPRGISKLSGARHVAKLLGAGLEEAVAIGDSANDLPMLRGAGRAVAVGNAPEPVRLAAHETVANGEDAGVAEAIFRHFS
jgi:Cof subfamily protein (haloacid dehalogenase superfamily)